MGGAISKSKQKVNRSEAKTQADLPKSTVQQTSVAVKDEKEEPSLKPAQYLHEFPNILGSETILSFRYIDNGYRLYSCLDENTAKMCLRIYKDQNHLVTIPVRDNVYVDGSWEGTNAACGIVERISKSVIWIDKNDGTKSAVSLYNLETNQALPLQWPGDEKDSNSFYHFEPETYLHRPEEKAEGNKTVVWVKYGKMKDVYQPRNNPGSSGPPSFDEVGFMQLELDFDKAVIRQKTLPFRGNLQGLKLEINYFFRYTHDRIMLFSINQDKEVKEVSRRLAKIEDGGIHVLSDPVEVMFSDEFKLFVSPNRQHVIISDDGAHRMFTYMGQDNWQPVPLPKGRVCAGGWLLDNEHFVMQGGRLHPHKLYALRDAKVSEVDAKDYSGYFMEEGFFVDIRVAAKLPSSTIRTVGFPLLEDTHKPVFKALTHTFQNNSAMRPELLQIITDYTKTQMPDYRMFPAPKKPVKANEKPILPAPGMTKGNTR